MARADTFEARKRRADLLYLHLVKGVTQKKIAEELGITSIRVGQIIRAGIDDVVRGKIALPPDYDLSNSRLLVNRMLFHACCMTWDKFSEANANYNVLSQLTISEKLNWIRKSKQIRWYQ